jgi:cytoskeletal protein CcmA (bactofilin family)
MPQAAHKIEPTSRDQGGQMDNPYDKPVGSGSSVLGPTLKFKGELTASEDLLIQGQIEGSINHTSSLTIGKEGKIKANVKAEYIAVEGTVDGDLSGSRSVVVKESANIKGNIYSPTVTLREGATFNGRIDMSGKQQPAAETPAKRADAAATADSAKPEPAAKKSSQGGKAAASAG